ncbi:hypothetical protein SteCoe_35654 [Stentor coeruleus]|uniref:G-protein coupled receptors family 2 profile 2 domain-containing protein n=1 Tax=Stentor coeruleus TaxID=5963 RepID=A0A1R2ARX5_9CILI|nr:hypothetical protein SteCoe_35654 [Stentor coeruleus]
MEESYRKTIYTIIVVANSLSILSCLLILSIYILAKNLRIYAFKLVSILCIIDILKSLSMILPTYSLNSSDSMCKIQGIFVQFFTLASFMMTFITGLALYMCIYIRNDYISKANWFFGIIVFIFPFIGTLLPWYYNMFEKDRVWCWVGRDPIFWRIITFYGPLWLLNGINLWIYIKIIRKINEREHGSIKRLRIYPLILVLCYLPATIERTFEMVSYGDSIIMIIMMGVGDGLLGLANAICYGFTDHVKNYVFEKFCKKKNLSTHELLDYEKMMLE